MINYLKFYNITILVSTILVLALNSCKKEKLEGNDKKLVGTWEWKYTSGGISGSGLRYEEGYYRKIEIHEKGRYSYSSGSEKIEKGILIEEDGFYKFVNRKLFGKKEIDGQKILKIGTDTIQIGSSYCCDTYVATYVKQ